MPEEQFKDMIHLKFWTDDVLLYMDGVYFMHKRNQYRYALTVRERIWRRPGEGLKHTTRGSKTLGSKL